MTRGSYEIAVLPGDGIGSDVMDAALAVLCRAAENQDLALSFSSYEAGASYYLKSGESISAATMEQAGRADAVLLGAMGLPDVRYQDGSEIVPQIEMREHFNLFASLRPCKQFAGVPTRLNSSNVDMLVIRELVEGLFAGRRDAVNESCELASDRMTITRAGCERLFALAFEQARTRRKEMGTPGHVTLLDKANVLRSNAFMRKVFDEVAARYPDVATARLYIDAGSMMFITNPERFDVVVTENVFGDIVSELGAGVVGGLGVAPSADVSETHAVFQPSHGSAPDIAGKGVANPIAMILSAAMMLDWLSNKHADDRCAKAAASIRAATAEVLRSGPKTPDLGGDARTDHVTNAICHGLEAFSSAA